MDSGKSTFLCNGGISFYIPISYFRNSYAREPPQNTFGNQMVFTQFQRIKVHLRDLKFTFGGKKVYFGILRLLSKIFEIFGILPFCFCRIWGFSDSLGRGVR